jgi:hypothetical protein
MPRSPNLSAVPYWNLTSEDSPASTMTIGIRFSISNLIRAADRA